MKFKKILPVIAAFALAFCMGAGAVSFTDVEGHWAYEQIMEYAEKGIVNGDPEGTFRPDDIVTREEFCKIMLNSFGLAGVNSESASFSDVSPEAWSYAYVEGAKKYLPGYEDGTYNPASPAKREDVTSAIVRVMGYPCMFVDDKEYALKAFSDCGEMDADNLALISSAVSKGIVNGFPDGTFKPDAGITRAEAVTLISRAVKLYNEDIYTWEDAESLIDYVYPENEDDSTVLMTINGYNISLSEFRYYYLIYNDVFIQYFGEGWFENTELLNLFDEYFNNDITLPGVLYALSSSSETKISMADMNKHVFNQYDAFYEAHGDGIDEYLAGVHATPNYMLQNCLYVAFMTEMQNELFGADGEYFEVTAKAFKDSYVRAKHVLVTFEGKASKEAAYAIAQTVYDKAVAGESFDTLIAQYNEDPGMSSNPDGYVFTYGEMVEPFEKASYALKDGEISGIVETDYGYHIIMRLPLDDESIAKSSAYNAAATEIFSGMLHEMYATVQIAYTENYDKCVIGVFEEAGHISTAEDETVTEIDIATASAEEIIGVINAIEAPEFMYGVIPVEISDADALKMFTGLDSAEGIKEVAVCESMMGSQAYSLVVVKIENADNAKKIAEAMKAGIDPRKWICVEADDIKVSAKGDVVMFIMVDSEYKESISASSVTEAFKTVCGGTLDFEF